MQDDLARLGQAFLDYAEFLKHSPDGEIDESETAEDAINRRNWFRDQISLAHQHCNLFPIGHETVTAANQVLILAWDELERADILESDDPQAIREGLIRVAEKCRQQFSTLGTRLVAESRQQAYIVSNRVRNEQRILAVLDTVTSFEFPGNPLQDVVDYISQIYNIPILLDELNLLDSGIKPDENICIVMSGVTLGSFLSNMLENVAGVELDHVVRNEVLLITTVDRAHWLRWERWAEEHPEEYQQILAEQEAGQDDRKEEGPESADNSGAPGPWHGANEDPPDDFHPIPIEGQKGQLAKWILSAGERSRRALDNFLTNNTAIWGRRNSARSFSVWFKTNKRYAEVNARRLAE